MNERGKRHLLGMRERAGPVLRTHTRRTEERRQTVTAAGARCARLLAGEGPPRDEERRKVSPLRRGAPPAPGQGAHLRGSEASPFGCAKAAECHAGDTTRLPLMTGCIGAVRAIKYKLKEQDRNEQHESRLRGWIERTRRVGCALLRVRACKAIICMFSSVGRTRKTMERLSVWRGSRSR